MPSFPTDKFELLDFRDSLIEQRQDALAAGNTDEAKRLEKEITQAQNAISRIALEGMASLANILDDLRIKLDALRDTVNNWTFDDKKTPKDHERPFRDDKLRENDFQNQGPDKPASEPNPVPPRTVPKVPKGWSENYQALWSTIQITDE